MEGIKDFAANPGAARLGLGILPERSIVPQTCSTDIMSGDFGVFPGLPFSPSGPVLPPFEIT